MNKNKSMFFTAVVMFCVTLSGFGGFFLGAEFGKNEQVIIENNQNEVNINGQK